MTKEEAARILDPETSRDALCEIEYYNGFSGEKAVKEAVTDACRIAAAALRDSARIDRDAWTAEWVEDGECDHKPYRVRDVEKWKKYKCSKCGYKAGRRNKQKFCPSCGRAMTPEAWAERRSG